MAARKRKKAKIIGPAQKKRIWKSFRELDLNIKKHKKILKLLSISAGGKP